MCCLFQYIIIHKQQGTNSPVSGAGFLTGGWHGIFQHDVPVVGAVFSTSLSFPVPVPNISGISNISSRGGTESYYISSDISSSSDGDSEDKYSSYSGTSGNDADRENNYDENNYSSSSSSSENSREISYYLMSLIISTDMLNMNYIHVYKK